MKLLVPILGQRDPQEALARLGTALVTIADDGCAITCLTMLLQYYKHTIDVDTLNNWLILNNGYTDGDLVNWDAISRLASDIEFIGDINCRTTPAPLDQINKELQAGHPVIIGVIFDGDPNKVFDPVNYPNANHYVIIVGIMPDGTYIINDPWYKDEVFLTGRYAINGISQEQAILQVLLYEGQTTSFVSEPKPSVTTSPAQVEQPIESAQPEVIVPIPDPAIVTQPETTPVAPVEPTPVVETPPSNTSENPKTPVFTPSTPSTSTNTPPIGVASIFTLFAILFYSIAKLLFHF